MPGRIQLSKQKLRTCSGLH